MAKKLDPADATVNFDDLLNPETELAEVPVIEIDENSDEDIVSFETPEQQKIRELKEQLAQPLPQVETEPVFAPVEKTPEQLEIEELETQLAQRNAAILDRQAERYAPPADGGQLVHVVEDGFNQFGRVWYRGQEFMIDAQAYERTQDRNGQSWVDTLLNDPHAQFARWGRVYIAPGPFVPRPGENFNDSLVQEDARRNRAIPVSVS